jgi:PAS domain S-box-containing protein
LHQSRELFKTLADISPVGIFRADARGRCLYVNARWSEICGFSAEQAMGDGWLAAIDPEDRDRLRRDWMEAVRQRRSLAREYRMRRPDGVAVWVLGQVAAEHGPGGTETSYVGTITDITAQKRAAETHLRSQKLEALGTLAGGIAHDFNNLLLAISGNTKLAVEELPSEHSAQESLKEIEKASARAAELVRRILTFSRAEEHKREVVELRPVVEEALQLLRATLPARIEIRADLSADVPAVAADSTQIHQIIINLATNSAHAIGEQAGLIELRLDPDQPSPELDDTLTGLGGRRWARLSVRDTGCGMDRETLGRIFDPFFTTKPPGQGTGLGLSLVHSIVARHDGAINVSSEPGQGTTFRLYFPGVDAIAATAAVEPPEPRDARSGHVLYVDDEEALVLLVSRTLKRRGYRVTACSNPAEALARFTLQPGDFDAVVTDLSMPGMSGFDLGSAILAVRPDVPIVMTSGYFRPEDQRRAEETGIRELILKPDTVEELWRSLDRLLGKPEVAS